MQPAPLVETWIILCTGIVQGVGFRPAVANLAIAHRITGKVANVDGNVLVEVQGRSENLRAFVEALRKLPPPVELDPLSVEKSVAKQLSTFEIAASHQTGQVRVDITPDQAICSECVDELRDTQNRRFGYTQIACNRCGPRFGSLISLPFDRENTTYSGFEPCPVCRAEYSSPDSRRFHGQLVSCPTCGPRASIRSSETPDHRVASDVAQRLARGELGLIKGLSGVHLVCRADDEAAVIRIRRAKSRPTKPFAVMVRSLSNARRLAILTEGAEALLESAVRPVVVARRQNSAHVAGSVAEGLLTIGLMLPSGGFYIQLLERLEIEHGIACGLVCTSANISGQTIPAGLEHVEASVAALADFQVDHDRKILTPCDDSVFLATAESITPIRLGRGSTPLVLRSNVPQVSAIGLAYGPKAAICSMESKHATLWQHLGSGLFNTREQFRAAISAVGKVSLITPKVAGIDLGMPEPFIGWVRSEGWVVERIQHHHAHAASVAVEHGLMPEPSIIGVICDGYGLGSDGTGWGGEVIEFDFATFRRLGGLRLAHHPSGVDRRLALLAHSFLSHADVPRSLRESLVPLSEVEAKLILAVSEGRVSGVRGGSTGRLFDCVSALLGLSSMSTYEGQAAILLEQLASTHIVTQRRPSNFPGFLVTDIGGMHILDDRPFFAALAPLLPVLSSSTVAYWFHVVLAEGFFALIQAATASQAKRVPVVLAGGCMQNSLFVKSLTQLLSDHGYKYYLPERLPANDGGVSVGLARIAGVRFGEPDN